MSPYYSGLFYDLDLSKCENGEEEAEVHRSEVHGSGRRLGWGLGKQEMDEPKECLQKGIESTQEMDEPKECVREGIESTASTHNFVLWMLQMPIL